MSIFDIINPFSYITPLHADDEEVETSSGATVVVASDPVEETEEAEEEAEEVEEEAEEEEEEEEDEDPEDPAPAIKEACGETLSCKSLKHHYEECAARVDDGSKESCAEELLHFMHCVDQCAVPQIFGKLK
ncbi:ubiquinol--cytochrome-c reductase subunit 6 [Coemansia sp. RSA 1813]|nr:ubiquinol--cytochrome-c reductase subunit 6 [Coemansia sp. RSA 1646]KAJ1771524.1 ubiquinol--cytochrome-c reductase subunit 6 [Coemansia sp. RSA 1843]KAJ2089617.1 ubiquinol--cytochrome-c reductase subunit 6 [Coemansia sp. RSA 986]KAJ2214719.1 ubiquinol--cytochrome-c reductase subunit 6 [Coemansia sp. RSA 487]KAJ2571531.1 ubiquinol--cytochrome-c reductase subunit 6 [Coemansia sp. RSA 1813]